MDTERSTPPKQHTVNTYLAHCGLIDTKPAGKASHKSLVASALLQLIGLMHDFKHVLVCCQGGVDRSVSITAAYLHMREGVPIDQAIGLIHKRRPASDKPGRPHEPIYNAVCNLDYPLIRLLGDL